MMSSQAVRDVVLGCVSKKVKKVGWLMLSALFTATYLGSASAQTPITQFSGGANHALAVKADGSLWGWGDNGAQELVSSSLSGAYSPMNIGSNFSFVAAGNSSTFAIKTDGSLFAWGASNGSGLGDGTTYDLYKQTFIGSGYSYVSAGGLHRLARKVDGTLWAWGRNNSGQLGDGSTTDRLRPVKIGSGYIAVSAGNAHSMAVKADGSLWTWGSNSNGELGVGTTVDSSVPVLIGSDYQSVAAGEGYSLAIKTDGSLWSWGDNTEGRLGQSSAGKSLLPVQIGSGYSAISAGLFFGLGLKSDGTLWAWGSDSTAKYGYTPVQIGSGYVSISAGQGFSIAQKNDGSLWAWGANSFGQLGDTTTTSRSVPKQIEGFGPTGTYAKLVSLSLKCPLTVPSSDTCLATATYNDGSHRAVSPGFSSSNTSAVTFGSSGSLIATTVTTDTAVTITATYSENGSIQTASAIVTVKANSPSTPTTPVSQGVCTGAVTNEHVLSIVGSSSKKFGDSLEVDYCLRNFTQSRIFDIYVVVQSPDGQWLFLRTSSFFNKSSFASNPIAYQASTLIWNMAGPILSLPTLPAGLPTGTYTIYAVQVLAGQDVMNPTNWFQKPAQQTFTLGQ